MDRRTEVSKRIDVSLLRSFELASDADRSRVPGPGNTACFTGKNPLPELSVRACKVFYAGEPIYEAESSETAEICRDWHIDLYA
jgi:hypothetical protein